jgi:thioredoxin reductase (NADPH)
MTKRLNTEETVHKVCIIGSGPAGYTASIYCARAMLKPVLITGYSIGGQLMTTTDIENFPGYVDGISGPDMMENLRAQAERFGTTFVVSNVKNVDCSSKPFRVFLDNDKEILTQTIIVATGAQALWLDLKGEKKLRSRGISTCATCDGAFFMDEDLIVIGGGDTAMEEATFLTRYAKSVTIIHRRDDFRASKIMLDRARKNDKIKWKTNTTVKEWVETEHGDLCGAVLNTPEGEEIMNCGGAFIAIGHKPNTDFLNEQIETDKNGYIVHKEHTMTSVSGVFACGDVVDTRYKQAITAAGQGCQAAMDVEKWLEEQE